MKPQLDVKAPIPQLLAQLNTIRVAKGLPQLRGWKQSRGDLVAAIAHTGVTLTRVPAAVADGAYKDNRQANERTAHTTNGKTASQSKKEQQMAKEVAKRTAIDVSAAKKPKASATTKPAQKRQAIPAGAFSLADWARAQKLSPKIARARARKHVTELKRVQLGKYVYPNKARASVTKILGGK